VNWRKHWIVWRRRGHLCKGQLQGGTRRWDVKAVGEERGEREDGEARAESEAQEFAQALGRQGGKRRSAARNARWEQLLASKEKQLEAERSMQAEELRELRDQAEATRIGFQRDEARLADELASRAWRQCVRGSPSWSFLWWGECGGNFRKRRMVGARALQLALAVAKSEHGLELTKEEGFEGARRHMPQGLGQKGGSEFVEGASGEQAGLEA
jgi:uncharacterized protein with PIN domain